MLWPVSISFGSRCRKSYGRSSWNLVPNGLLHQVILGVIHWKAIPVPALPMRCLDEQISRNWDTPLKINMEHNHFKWGFVGSILMLQGGAWMKKFTIQDTFDLFFFVWGFGGICESCRDGYSQSHDSSRIFTCNWLSLTKKTNYLPLEFSHTLLRIEILLQLVSLKAASYGVFVCGWFYQGIFSVPRELCREAMVVGIPSPWIVHLFVFLRQTPRPSHIAPFLLKTPLGWPR